MYPTPELIAYIQSQLASGFSREVIVSALRSAGWSSSAIVEAFAQGTPATPMANEQQPGATTTAETSTSTSTSTSPSSAFPQSSVRGLYTQPTSFESASPMVDMYHPRAVDTSNQTLISPQIHPVLVNTSADSVVSTSPKKKSKGMILASIFLCVLIIAGALGFLYAKQKGIDVPAFIQNQIASLTQKKETVDTSTHSLTQTEELLYNAFDRLAKQQKLETQTVSKVSLPRANSQTGGFINDPATPSTDTSPMVPTDVVDVRVVSQRDTSSGTAHYHTMVLAQSSESTEVDAELRIVGKVAHVILKKLSLLDALGMSSILNTWIDIQSIETDLPLLKSIGLPGDIIKMYVQRLAQRTAGTTTLVQHLLDANVFRVSDTPRSSIIDTTAIREYDVTVDTEQLPTAFLAWLMDGATLPTESAEGLRNFLGALTEVKGMVTLNAETNDIMIVELSVTGLIEKGIPFTVSSTLNFITAPTIIPISVLEPATPLQSVIDTFLTQMGGTLAGDEVPTTTPPAPLNPNPVEGTGGAI